MKPPAKHYVNPRVLKLNVGHLIAAGSGHSQDTAFDIPAIRLDHDLILDYVKGPIRLSRNKEGILVQGHLEVGYTGECARCLDPLSQTINVEIEELYGHPVRAGMEFAVSEDGVLDLAPLLRDEVWIATSHGVLCRDDCKGLCPECGANWNHATCTCGLDDIDPRLAGLQALLNDSDR